MIRKATTHVLVLVVALMLGVEAVAVASQRNPSAHTASDSQIVSQLRSVNSELVLINKNLGGYGNISVSPSVTRC